MEGEEGSKTESSKHGRFDSNAPSTIREREKTQCFAVKCLRGPRLAARGTLPGKRPKYEDVVSSKM